MVATPFITDDEEQTYFSVGLDDETVARLIELCEEAKVEPRRMISALVRAVLADDYQAHAGDEPVADFRKDANKDLH